LGGSTYYIDGDGGSDASNGKSPDHAWKSLDAVNARTFEPGDSIQFKAGTHYTGQLAPNGSGALVDGKPVAITLGKYGTGDAPRLDGNGEVLDTLLIRNIEYWDIRDLEITNKGPQSQPWRTGVHLLADGNRTLHGIHLSNLYVHDVNGDLHKTMEGCGIYFESRGGRGRGRAAFAANTATGPATTPTTMLASEPARFDGLIIENCHLLRTDRNGICQRTTGGGAAARSTHVIIRNNLLEDIGGDGIKLWGSDGGLVEHNTIHGGHMRCEDPAAGIWPFASDNSLIQFNEVSGMKTTSDGEGFDSDYQCRGNIFQFNYSHDNVGGFMLICSPGNSFCQKTVIRYNVSQNDGSNNASVFNISGKVTDSLIYNNIIYTGPKQHLALLHYGTWNNGTPQRTSFFNNIFYADGSVKYVWGKSSDNLFDHNIFYGNHINPPKDEHGLTTKPALVNPGGGADGFKSLAAYQWLPGNAAPRGKQIPDHGTQDFFGNLLSTDGDSSVGIQAVGK
jgi:hypothetical protein